MVITEDMLKSLIRWDISWEEFWKDEDWKVEHEHERYKPTWEDVEALIDNIRKRNPTVDELGEDWGCLFNDDYMIPDRENEGFYTLLIDEYYVHDTGYMEKAYLENDDEGIAAVLDLIGYLYDPCCFNGKHVLDTGIDWKKLMADIDFMEVGDFDRDIAVWHWSEEGKLDCVKRFFGKDESLVLDSDDRREIYSILDELCEHDNIEALDLKAYLCYGGSELMSCDWFASRDCLLKLMDLTEDTGDERRGQYANTLGYMYYYGRCSDGVPDYETALKYYVIGGAYGYYESIYKIADMLKSGKAVPKDRNAAKSLVERVYDLTKKDYLKGDGYSDFADAAFRMGINAKEDGDYENALKYLQEAECAIKDRAEGGFYGDDKVAMAIDENLREVKAICEENRKKEAPNPYLFSDEPDFAPLSYLVEIGSVIKCKLIHKDDDEVVLEFSDDGEYRPSSVFVEAEECGMLHLTRFSYVFHGVKDFKIHRKSRFRFSSFDNYFWQDPKKIGFYTSEGKEKCSFTYEKVELVLPGCLKPKSGDRHLFVSCSFYDGGRTYDYIADGFDVKVGDLVVVNSYQGEADVLVEAVEEKCVDDLPIPFEKYKPILRVVDRERDTEQ